MSSSHLQRALGYRKFQGGGSPRLLLMAPDYYVVRDIHESARHLGWEVQDLPVGAAGQDDRGFLRELLQSLVEFRPDFVLTVNYFGFDQEGELASLLERYDVPLAAWFVDHPLMILGGASANARSNAQVFCLERTALPWLCDFGFDEPRHLPTGSNASIYHPDRIDAELSGRLGADLCFVGGSWWPRARGRGNPRLLERARALAEGHPLDKDFLMHRLPAVIREEELRGDREAVFAASVALAEESLQVRAQLLRSVLPLDPVVHGDAHWSELVHGLDLRPPVDPRTETPAVFAGSRVNLNVTSSQLPSGVNQRVWDVPGAGGFLLTDAREDVLENFTEGVDCSVYRSPEEACDKARYWLEHESERERLAARAHARVEAEHRVHHRLEAIERRMRARFSSRIQVVSSAPAPVAS